ncbi:MAG: T9SS type A sorting domain-containing protein [Bacteroidetes bacterium]|nr:T9SS type A sorting domain-containing protein [Bacteroidota bacterium]
MRRIFTIIAWGILIHGTVLTAQPVLQRAVVGGGASFMSGAVHSLRATVGQPGTGYASTAGHGAGLGFWYRVEQGGTDADAVDAVPRGPELGENYPNPFGPGSPSQSPSTRITLRLQTEGHTLLAVYDIIGRQRAVLIDERLAAGNYIVRIQADQLDAGVYIYRLVQGDEHIERKMLLLR